MKPIYRVFRTTQSDLLKFNGTIVLVLAPLPEAEYDKEDVGPMFRAQFKDGIIRDVFDDELF